MRKEAKFICLNLKCYRVNFCNAQSSPAEIQGDLAIASIENVFVYSDRYGHSDLKSD